MSTNLPQPIAAFIQATNDHNTHAVLATLTTNAVVTDEGHTYRGMDEIREWNDRSINQFNVTIDVTDVVARDGETIVTAQVVGTFDGSPAQFHFHFTTDDDKIAAMRVVT